MIRFARWMAQAARTINSPRYMGFRENDTHPVTTVDAAPGLNGLAVVLFTRNSRTPASATTVPRRANPVVIPVRPGFSLQRRAWQLPPVHRREEKRRQQNGRYFELQPAHRGSKVVDSPTGLFRDGVSYRGSGSL